MKKIFISLCLLTVLMSCNNALVTVEYPETETSIADQNIMATDTVRYQVLYTGRNFSVYDAQTHLIVYKDCISLYKNDILDIPVGGYIISLVLFFIIGLILGFIIKADI